MHIARRVVTGGCHVGWHDPVTIRGGGPHFISIERQWEKSFFTWLTVGTLRSEVMMFLEHLADAKMSSVSGW